MKIFSARYLWLAAAFVLVAAAASAQSLLDNEFYKNAQTFLSQSKAAMQTGDYDGAAQLVARARESLARSDDYVATMTFFYRANGWLSQANDRVAYAKSIDADTNFKTAYDTAVADARDARTSLDAKDYQESIDLSKSAIAALTDIAPVEVAAAPVAEPTPATQPAAPAEQPAPASAEPLPLPAYYVVRFFRPLADCFWRIAALPFVYGNPWKWRLLYDANKEILPDPYNPDLIEVGQRFVIPSASGETREGDYDPQKQYLSIAVP